MFLLQGTAFVVLALFGLALGRDTRTYSWHGPGATPPPVPDNLCLTDPMSCSCCLMQQRMWQMQQHFNSSVTDLQERLNKTQNILNSYKESRTAFSVALTDWRRCVGPSRTEIDVAYQAVFLNMGVAYDTRTGVFTAPHSGIYSLAVTAFSDAGSPGSLLAACVQLSRNGVVLAGLQEKNHEDQEDTASVVLTVQLRARDRVSVRLLPGCYLCDDQNHYNTFSGFMLYTTE
ncbi:uncharacterized protein LOC121710068 [Alosa sapidissima]|uniref:uncharacterized protein LOC121710068 n=1 Tax=Alosa sapidissima TaxID=34773 RepID=UPI001C09951D|nr:uncharacterized protein LOC121710068 [Alosa sapidissima]